MERLGQKKKLDQFIDKWFHDKAEGTLVAAFHPFESPSDFEILIENHLRRLIDRSLPRSVAATSEARAVWKKGSPFRGLAAFEFEHAEVFFGRTRAVSDILNALRKQAAEGRPFALILGMSGGGKSSVVRAGVLPMLIRPGVIEGVGLWRRAVFRPTDVRGDLFEGLGNALIREHALPSLDPDGNGPDELAAAFRQSPQAATSLVRNALAREEAEDGQAERQARAGHRSDGGDVHAGGDPARASAGLLRRNRFIRPQRAGLGDLHAAQRLLSAARKPAEARRAEGRRRTVRPPAANGQRDRPDDPSAGERGGPALRGGPGEQRAPRRHAARRGGRTPGNPPAAAVHPRGALPASYRGRHADAGRVSRARRSRRLARAARRDRLQAPPRRRRSRAAEGAERAGEHRPGRSGGDRPQARARGPTCRRARVASWSIPSSRTGCS